MGLPKGNISIGARLIASLNRNPNLSGFGTVMFMLALAIALVPISKRRWLSEAWLAQMAYLQPRLTLRRPEKARIRMPVIGWRLMSLVLLVAITFNQPGFDQMWTARAQCNIVSNASTPTTRVTQFTYDVYGHVILENKPEGVVNYGYDPISGEHTSTCTANSEVEYGYDLMGRLQTVSVVKRDGVMLANAEITTYGYDAVGRTGRL